MHPIGIQSHSFTALLGTSACTGGLNFSLLKFCVFGPISFPGPLKALGTRLYLAMHDSSLHLKKYGYKRVSMGLRVSRKTAENLAVRRKYERILTVSRKKCQR